MAEPATDESTGTRRSAVVCTSSLFHFFFPTFSYHLRFAVALPMQTTSIF
jgi:hypothetical protein